MGATALMLLTMERRSFVVTIAYLKTEPAIVALFGFLFLRDPVTLALIEIVFAQAVSRFVFRHKTTPREALGIAILIAGAIWLVRTGR